MKNFILTCLLFAIASISVAQQNKPAAKPPVAQQKTPAAPVTIESLSKKIEDLKQLCQWQQVQISRLEQKVEDSKNLERSVDNLRKDMNRLTNGSNGGGSINSIDQARSIDAVWEQIRKLLDAVNSLKTDVEKLKRN